MLPADFVRILEKALEKDRNLRCQTATELKTDLSRLKRDLESSTRRAREKTDSDPGVAETNEKIRGRSLFENLSGAKEDEYLRDGITEDVITELSKIRGTEHLFAPYRSGFSGQAGNPGASASSSARPMSSPALCAARAHACASARSWSIRTPIFRCGRSDSTAR